MNDYERQEQAHERWQRQRRSIGAVRAELLRRLDKGAESAVEAAAQMKALLAAAQEPGVYTTGVLRRPQAFGLVELGRVDWSDDRLQFCTTLVYVDASGGLYAATLLDSYGRLYEVMSESDMSALVPVADADALLAYLVQVRDVRRGPLPLHPSAAAEAARVLAWARNAQRAMAAA